MKHILIFLCLLMLIIAPEISIAQETSLTATVNPDTLNIRAEPGIKSPQIGQLTRGSLVNVLGQADLGYYGSWVYVQDTVSNLTGWVAARYLNFPPGTVMYPFNVPTLWRDYRTPSEPIFLYGYLMVFTHRYDPPRYRGVWSEPSWDSTLLGRIGNEKAVYVYGQVEEREEDYRYWWVYVKEVNGDLQGWMPRGVYLPFGFSPEALPVLPPIANPPLPEPYMAEPVTSLNAITTDRAELRYDAALSYEILDHIPVGTSVTLTGRNASGSYYKTVINGREGWIRRQSLLIEGEPYRLPILTLKDNLAD